MILDATLFITNYLAGSFMFAIHIPRWLKMDDPRDYGSCNPGTTNAFRQSSRLGLWVFLGDLCKGLLAGKLALLGSSLMAQSLIGFASFLGHIFPIFHKFRGGKGIATGFGLWIILCPTIAAVGIGTWLIIFFSTKRVSLASIAAASLGAYASLYQNNPYSLMIILMMLITLIKHTPNIIRTIEFK